MTRKLLSILMFVAACLLTSSTVHASEPVKLSYKCATGDFARLKVFQHTTGTRIVSGSTSAVQIDIELIRQGVGPLW